MPTKNTPIALNFLELKPKSFDVIFYRRKLDQIPEEQRHCYYIRHLKNNESSNTFEKFAISFDPVDGFEKKTVENVYNIDLSKQFIFFAFGKHLERQGISTVENSRDKYQRYYLPLNSFNEGVETIWIEPYYLKQIESFGFLLDFKFTVNEEYEKTIAGTVDKRILQLSGTLDSKGYSNKAFYQFRYEKIQAFFHKYYASVIQFELGSTKFSLSKELTPLTSQSLNPRIYQFFNEAENTSPYFGLQKNLPYQKPDLDTKYLFVFKESDRNVAIELLNGLKGVTYPTTFPGIQKLFNIPFDNDCIKGKKVIDLTPAVLDEVVAEVKAELQKGNNLLPIILTNSKLTSADDRLYHIIKHTFTKHAIACQVVTKELVNNTNSIKYSLSNIGLQIFAKAGGKPWKVKPAIKECLIIGIGSKNKEVFVTDQNGKTQRIIEKYVTYSVLTDSSGLFKEIQTLSDTDNEEHYYQSLINKLTSIINQASSEGATDIVIHTPFRISKEKVWNKLFAKVGAQINITILLINSSHKYFGFDFSKNALVPYESSLINLSRNEYLVWFEGLQFNHAPFSKPIGSPIYIHFWYTNNWELLNNDNYRRSLLQDCINLSGANWRGFKAKQLPVSIFYCQKIADFLRKFETYQFEHIEFENLKPWFL